MPELPIYKEMGIGPQKFGQIEYANLQDELRRGRDLEGALDKLSAWAYKKMEGRAKQAGAEWAAQNPITHEQLTVALNEKDTNKRNAALASLIGGDPSTVTGEAILDVQIGQVRSMLELDARKEVAGIDALAQTGRLQPGEVLEKLNALSAGYGETLAKMGGAAGAKEAESLRASIASISQPVFNAVSQQFIDQNRLAAKAAIASGISQVQTTLRPLVDALVTAPEGGRDAALANLLTAQARIRKDITTLAIVNNDPAALEKLDSAMSGANIAAITNYLGTTGDMSNALGAIGSGDIGNLTPIFALMSNDDRDKLRNSIRTYYADQTSAEKQRVEDVKNEGRSVLAPLINDYISGGGKDDALLERIGDINLKYEVFAPEHIAAIESAAKSAVAPNYGGMLKLMAAAVNGQVKPAEIVSAGSRYGLSAKDSWTVFSQVVSADAKLLRDATKAAEDAGNEVGGTDAAQNRVKGRTLEILEELRKANKGLPENKRKTDTELQKEAKEAAKAEALSSAYQKRVDSINDLFKEGNLGLKAESQLTPGYITATVQNYEINLINSGKDKKTAKLAAQQLKAQLNALAQQQKAWKGR